MDKQLMSGTDVLTDGPPLPPVVAGSVVPKTPLSGDAPVASDASEVPVFLSDPFRVAVSTVHGQRVAFAIANVDDVIQSHHARGAFYEPEELAIICRHFPTGGRFCDIGANVGNHSVYLARFMYARRIVLIEPNPLAIGLLKANVHLNGIDTVCDLSRLGIGLSDGAVSQAFIRTGHDNLGGARVKEGQGDIPVKSGDDLLGDEAFDLIKIDVEGMEIKVLNGLKSHLDRHRPKIFIEVDKRNYDAFEAWRTAEGYDVLERFQRYKNNTNFMIGARS